MSSSSLFFKASPSTECSPRTRCCPAHECLGQRLCHRWFYRRMFRFAAKYCSIEESRFSTRCASDGSPLAATDEKCPTKSIWSRERIKYFARGNLIFPSSWFAIGRALIHKPRHFSKNEMRWCSRVKEATERRWWATTAILQVHIPAPRYVPYSACFRLISASVRSRPLRIAPTSWMMRRTLSDLHVGMFFVLFRFVSFPMLFPTHCACFLFWTGHSHTYVCQINSNNTIFRSESSFYGWAWSPAGNQFERASRRSLSRGLQECWLSNLERLELEEKS